MHIVKGKHKLDSDEIQELSIKTGLTIENIRATQQRLNFNNVNDLYFYLTNPKFLYMIVENNELELPVFIGNLKETCKFLRISEKSLNTLICKRYTTGRNLEKHDGMYKIIQLFTKDIAKA